MQFILKMTRVLAANLQAYPALFRPSTCLVNRQGLGIIFPTSPGMSWLPQQKPLKAARPLQRHAKLREALGFWELHSAWRIGR